MHAVQLLHKHLQRACPTIHSKRLKALICATKTLSENHHLSITGIGRAMPGRTSPKHNIKRVDRLVGNVWLQAERLELYSAMTQWVLKHIDQPAILIDWSDLTADREQQLLRASVPVGGRSLTLYEEVHPLRLYANPRIHKLFLMQLRNLLPEGTRPIIVTDAGFRGTWIKLVNALGWHWIGRVRNRDYVLLSDTTRWIPCKSLYQQATRHAKRLGKALLARTQRNAVILHLIKQPKKGRIAKSTFGQPIRNARGNKIAKRQREPWLIAASPSLSHLTAKQVISIYSKRMQIEEAFRDIKCERYGLGLSTSLTKGAKRLEILLLLGALALWALWLTGASAIKQKDHYRYQSNTQRQRRVLSTIFLGMQIMKHDPGRYRKPELLNVLSDLQQNLNYAI